MNYKNCSKENFYKYIEGRKVICIGASKRLQRIYTENASWFDEWKKGIDYFVDNDENKWNKEYALGNSQYKIYPFSKIKTEENVVFLITTLNKYIIEICEQLEAVCLNEGEVFALGMLLNERKHYDDSAVENDLKSDRPFVNKKIIHTFWFSGDDIPDSYVKCIESWKKYCPDYEIKIWNSKNYDVNKNKYMSEAFEAKKWAFVSDYARLDVVYQYGGIYLDMDVEILRNIDDLLKLECFFGVDEWDFIDLGTGFGALPGNSLIKDLLEVYKDRYFYLPDGTIDQEAQPQLLLDTFIKHGYKRIPASQKEKGACFLSVNYLNVFEGTELNRYHSSGYEYLVHRHHAGWWTEEKRKARYDECYRDREILEKKFKFCD